MSIRSPLVRLSLSQLRLEALLCFLLAAANAVAVADERATSTPEATAKAKALIENVLKERERVDSGIVIVRGSQLGHVAGPPPVRPIRQMYAFDHAHGKLRFDSSTVEYVQTITPAKLAAAGKNLKIATGNDDGELVNALLRYVRTGDYSASWNKITNNEEIKLHVRPPDGQIGGGIASRHHLHDLRGCGLMSLRQFGSGDFERGKTVADLCESLLKLPVVSVTEKEGLSIVALRTDNVDYRLVVDANRQFCPVEYTIQYWKGGGNSSDHVYKSRTEWRAVAGVMVPKSFSVEFDWPEEKISDRYRFEYEWLSVNQEVAEEYFDFRSFPDIPVNTKVVDTRAKGDPVTIGVWTKEGYAGPAPVTADLESDEAPDKPAARDAALVMRAGDRPGQERNDNGLKMGFVWCPPGKFRMGSPPTEPDRFDVEDQVDVVLSTGFWLGKYEVTQSQWKQMQQPPLWLGEQYVKEGDEYPATYLNFDQALTFCEKLTRQERAAGRLPPGWQYTLPTEAQWEYACRAGTTTRFSFGDDESLLEQYAWVRNNTTHQNETFAHPVGAKKPNAFGLHDMHGNVWEWCRDGFQNRLPGGRDPLVAAQGTNRVIRGGSWFGSAASILSRSAMRNDHHATNSAGFSGDLGFRVALCPAK